MVDLGPLAGAGALPAPLSSVPHALSPCYCVQAEAVESAETVGPSAATLLLETDPAERGPRESSDLHYAELALGQLHSALDMHTNMQHLLEHTFGVEEAERLLKANTLMVAAADCQLWRDRMEQLVSSVRRRQQANEVLPCD